MPWDLYKKVSTTAQVETRLKQTIVKKLQFLNAFFLKNNWKILGTYFYRLSYDWLGHIQACNRKTTLPHAFDRLHVCQFHKCCKLEGTIKKVFELKISNKNNKGNSKVFNNKNIEGILKETEKKLNIFYISLNHHI